MIAIVNDDDKFFVPFSLSLSFANCKDFFPPSPRSVVIFVTKWLLWHKQGAQENSEFRFFRKGRKKHTSFLYWDRFLNAHKLRLLLNFIMLSRALLLLLPLFWLPSSSVVTVVVKVFGVNLCLIEHRLTSRLMCDSFSARALIAKHQSERNFIIFEFLPLTASERARERENCSVIQSRVASRACGSHYWH